MSTVKKYSLEYKKEAIKLAKEIGIAKAGLELGVSKSTVNGWVVKAKKGEIDLGIGTQNPESGMTLVEEIQSLRKANKEQSKEIKRLNELNEFLEEASAFFAKKERLKFIDLKTENGSIRGQTAFYCRALNVSRQSFYDHLQSKNRPYKYADILIMMQEIMEKDLCNDTYGYIRMKQALDLVNKGQSSIPIERTVYRIMTKGKLIHRPKRKPNGITKADKQARKSDDLIKRDFSAEEPLIKCVTDITEIPAKDGKLYVSCIFDCFDNAVLGISMANNMKAALCSQTLKNAFTNYPELAGAIVHSD